LHCLTFAAAHLGAINYLLRSFPPAHAGAVQLAYSAALGIGFGLASLLSGILYQWNGGSAAFLAMAAMAGLGTVAAQYLARHAHDARFGAESRDILC
jgi:PPP family 3-phenylpropionic acid transporter